MAKSARDATRFTPTTPHASSIPPSSPPPPPRRPFPAASSPSNSRISPSTAPPLPNRATQISPQGETPQEKVRRLRAAALRAREAQVSGLDRFLVRGRVWADRAHRFTALSLIGITAIAGVITVYALGDMMIYNRRKRSEYYAEQRALQGQKADDEKEEAASGRPEMAGVGAHGGVVAEAKENDRTVRDSEILRAVEERNTDKRGDGRREVGVVDRLEAELVANEASSAETPKQSGGWTSFMSRR